LLYPIGSTMGGQHNACALLDGERTRVLEEWGYHVVPVWNNDVLGKVDGVREAILQEIELIR
jgi:very-short-patch-repair endonuclease